MSNATGETKLPLTLVIILAFIAAFSFQGSRGLYETTEGRYAEAAREMVERGNYLIPTLDYRPHWTKPPLAYWGLAGGIKLFGQSEWGLRFSNSLAFFLTTIAVLILGSVLWEQKVGLIAGLIYLSSPFPLFGANAVSTDTLLTLWEVLAVLCYLKAYRGVAPSPKRVWVAVMWIAFGLGFLTKGPPGLLPLIPLIVWNYTRKDRVPFFTGFGVLLFLIIGFSWFIVVTIENSQLVKYFLKTEVIERVSSKAVHNSEWYGPFTVFLPVLLAGQGPWLYFSARALWRSARIGPRRFVSFISNSEEVLFLLLWISLPLLIFSVVQSRLELYVLPLYAPIALLAAFWIKGFESITRTRLFVVATISVFILVGAKYGIARLPNRNNMKQVYEMSLQLNRTKSEYFVFQEERLYGMQYYLNGRMRRVTVEGSEPWADGAIGDLVSSLENGQNIGPWLILTSARKAPLLEKALSGHEVDVRTRRDKHWVWYEISRKR